MKLNVSLSARNQIPGTLKEIKKGQTTSHLKIDVGSHIVTASITNEAVDDLQLKVGDSVWAIIKASDVMVAK
jgi:molybdopterin-binding protein